MPAAAQSCAGCNSKFRWLQLKVALAATIQLKKVVLAATQSCVSCSSNLSSAWRVQLKAPVAVSGRQIGATRVQMGQRQGTAREVMGQRTAQTK